MRTKQILAKTGAVAAVAASTVLMSGAMAHAQEDQQGSYVSPATTVLAVLPPAQPPTPTTVAPAPPVVVGTIPQTGSNGVGSTSTIAATIAAAGIGMVFAARRRRETTAS